ncbi:hypothetical protein [Bacteroides sp. 51]|uniref:hypothetical protein n=1 Tax=Bacteroides sp. 51 TaxID=2302938 RepID=UPI0013D5B05C|nr:hypothetical protein [Bacteroides sp. 51]NDV81181.1 hypothetical protein [Bacteroides sp. 51]
MEIFSWIKRTLAFIVIILIGHTILYGQNKLAEEYIKEAGDFAVIYSGELETNYNPFFYLNDPYYISQDYTVGELVYRGNTYANQKMLKYNPLNIRTVNIYDGRYLFGGEMYECMISFVSHRQNLSAIQLDENSQLLPYDCPFLPETDKTEYADEQARKSLKPDFRHTLYWNPFVESIIHDSSAEMSFYTSDLAGEFKVVVEGFTKDGKAIYGTTLFSVVP